MRYPGSEKLEIIRTVEASHLPARQTLAMLGIPRTTYYRWYDRWSEGGLDALEDTAPHPGSVWIRLPDETRADIIDFALEHEDLTPRELAVKYTDEKQYFGECHELCVSVPVHAVSDTQASKRSPNIMANWLRAANHSLTFLPSFSKLRMAR